MSLLLRQNQDVGYDGMDDEYERTFIPPNSGFNSSYLDLIESQFSNTSQAYLNAFEDPAADNFRYFRSSDLMKMKLAILNRYKLFNGIERNSPTSEQSYRKVIRHQLLIYQTLRILIMIKL